MKDPYFRWERAAAIHLLYPTLEGSMKLLEDFCGYGYPTTILIFKNGLVSWICKEDEFYKEGEKLLTIYIDPKKEKEMYKEWVKRLDALNKIEREIDKINLGKMSSEKLTQLHKSLHDTFVAYYTIGAMDEPLAMQAEADLKNSTTLSDDRISHLTNPLKISFSKEAEDCLLNKGINEFLKKYFWIDNNYSGTKVLSKEDVKKRLEHIKSSGNQKDTQKYNLSPEAERLAELLRNFGAYQDERKRNILIYLHYLEILLYEIGKRGKVSLELMRDTFPQEVKDILEGKISEEFIKARREKCFVVWEEGKEKPQILTGDDTKLWEDKLSIQHDSVKVIKGNCASKGKVRGKVRVLLKAADHDKLKKGEVLVTFMTSPDFMIAIRKCSAIVTNLGGVTSHAAIISRELKIPCVVGTKNATEVLKTGDLIEVDADNGIVKKIS